MRSFFNSVFISVVAFSFSDRRAVDGMGGWMDGIFEMFVIWLDCTTNNDERTTMIDWMLS